MKVKVRVFGELVALLGKETVVELGTDARLKDLVHRLTEKTGSPQKGFLGRYSATGQDLVVLLNGRNIYTLEKFETQLKDGDSVTILPLAVGGRCCCCG